MGIETASEAWEGAGVRVLTQEGEACRYAATSMRNGIEGLRPWLLCAILAPESNWLWLSGQLADQLKSVRQD
jgi:hypothetical protein